MGFRRTLRRRLKGVINSPQLDTKKPLPPSPTDPPQSHLAKPPEHITAVENLQRNVKPLTIYHSVVKPPASRTSLGGGVRSEPSVISSRTSLFDNASRLRRLFREKVLKKAEGSEASENEVPEYISEEELKEGDKDASVRNDEVLFPPFTPWIDGVIDAEVGKLLPVGLNAEGNDQVNDGFISFTVPDGWTACRKEDCFYLLKGLSVGYVRSVPSTGAANALLETNRLQIVSNVSVRTSPEYGSPRRICSAGKKREEVTNSPYLQVDYSSYFGMGKGEAVFTNGFKSGACVFALCGPREDTDIILRGIDELHASVILLGVRCENRTSGSVLNSLLSAQDSGLNGADSANSQQSSQTQCSIQ